MIVLEVVLLRNGGILAPKELGELLQETTAALAAAGVNPSGGPEGLVISGRLPVWAAVALVHAHGHARPWVATHDPRLGGGVVTMSHVPNVKVGDVVPLGEGKIVVKF
ncbi:CRISPR-associated ring nuclease Crn3/Csx3 [Fervidobacterium sp.]